MATEIIAQTNALTVESDIPLDRNPAAVYIASLSERSRRVQMQSLRSIVAIVWNVPLKQVVFGNEEKKKRNLEGVLDVLQFPFHELRYQHTQAIRAKLAETMSFHSANRCLSALRRVLKECWRLEYMDNETMARACDISNITGETVLAGDAVSKGEINAIVDHCATDTNEALGVRDMAILAILYTTGMRRRELVGLTLDDYTPEEAKLIIRYGKRNKQREVYLSESAQTALDDWLTYRDPDAGTDTKTEADAGTDTDTKTEADKGALFLRVLKSGKIIRKQDANKNLIGLSSQAIYDMLARRARESNVKEFTPHDLRRTFVGDSLDAGVDIATVANIAGHSNIQTTARYDRRGERAKQEAVKKLHFPYRKRRKLMETTE